MIESFASHYQPSSFQELYGQDTAVRMTRNLLASDGDACHVLFHGAVGSGKTTLARLYGRALNCRARQSDGSPCWKCVCCQDIEEKNYFEIDVPRDKESVLQKVQDAYRRPVTAPFRVLFLDEVHALKKEHADALLKRIEDPEPGIIFILATTEPENVRRAMVSRVLPIEIRRLPRTTAFELLQSVADRAGLSYDPDALMLLAGLGDGFPRDLLNRLELLRKEKHLTRDRLLELFDIDHESTIANYFHALADGDETTQHRLFQSLNETVADKVRWIRAFLLKIYFVSQGQAIDVDPVIDTMQPEIFRQIIARFEARLGPLHPETWLSLLEILSSVTAGSSSASVLIHHANFEHRINRGIDARQTERQVSRSRPGQKEPSNKRATEAPNTASASHFLGLEDVRRVVHSASFMTQRYGVLFNARLTFSPGVLKAEMREGDVKSLMTKLLGDLERACQDDLAAPFAWLMVTKRAGDGAFCDAVLRLPPLLDGSTNYAGWLRDWCIAKFGTGSTKIATIELASKSKAALLKFHWDHALAMVAGVSDSVVAWDKERREESTLR